MDSQTIIMAALAGFVAAVSVPAYLQINLRIKYREKVASFESALRRPPDGNEYRDILLKIYRKLRAKANIYLPGIEPNLTPRQLFCRAARELPVDRAALDIVRELYEKARYTDREITKAEWKKALEAYRKVDSELGRLMFDLDNKGLSVQKYYQTEELASAVRNLAKERHRGEPEPGFWIIAPDVSACANSEGGKEHRAAPTYRDGERRSVLEAYGQDGDPSGPGLSEETVDRLYDAAAAGDHRRLGGLMLELAEGPARDRRVHLDIQLVSYLLEFEQRAVETGLMARTGPADRLKVLRAANVLALAEKRDYLLPDDLKLALYCAGPTIYNIDKEKIRFVLDHEKRVIEFPKGPRLLMPYPVETRGMWVPVE